MRALVERDTDFLASLRLLPRAITPSTFSAGFVAAVMGVTGPTLLVFQAAVGAGFSKEEIGSWFFGIFVGGGLMTLVLALAYRQPMTAAYSIAGSALLVQVLPGFSLNEAVGAYLISGALILLLGLSGLFERIMRVVPAEIVLGMLAGVLLRFVVGLFPDFVAQPLLIGATLLAFFLAHRLQRLLPPFTIALAVGILLTLYLEPLGELSLTGGFTRPFFFPPAFTLDAFLSLSLPLMLLALSSQNATGIGVLWTLGYRAPINAITLATGLFSLLTAPMGGHGINLATPMTAICGEEAAHPDPGLRYGAAIVNGILFALFGGVGVIAVELIEVLPLGLIRVISGLALLPVILNALQKSVGGERHRFGCLFALAIAASDVQWLGVGAAFWALVFASGISLLLDRDWGDDGDVSRP